MLMKKTAKAVDIAIYITSHAHTKPVTTEEIASGLHLSCSYTESILKELREAGFVTHGSDGYSVTPTGVDLLKRISDLQAFAGKWSATQARKKLPKDTP